MADYPIDLDFCDLTPEQALQIASVFAATGSIEKIAVEGNAISWDELCERFVSDRLYEWIVWVHCREICINGMVIAAAGMQLGGEKTGVCYVELTFAMSAVDRRSWGVLTAQLHAFAIAVQGHLGVPQICAGIQAEDPSWRLFTGSSMGPVYIDESGVHFPK